MSTMPCQQVPSSKFRRESFLVHDQKEYFDVVAQPNERMTIDLSFKTESGVVKLKWRFRDDLGRVTEVSSEPMAWTAPHGEVPIEPGM